jgi:hypothetical protein
VRYAEVAPRVDLEFYGATDGFEYDLVVRPGGDPSAFSIRIDGVSAVRASEDGGLTLDTPAGAVRQHAPVAYQKRDGVRTRVDVRYELHGKRLAFRTGTYDRSRPLVIDPTIDFSTYVGGSGADAAAAVATDAAGNIYVTGSTASTDFPTASSIYSANAGGTDAFVMKLAPDGASLVYATYLGGTANDAANGIAVSAAGSAYVAGVTSSSDFPAVNQAQTWNGGKDAFVTRLSADGGSVVFSTYLGGSGNDDAHSIAIDGAGAAYVTGPTTSSTFPLLNAFRTTAGGSFITKLSAGGTLVYSTYFGDADDTAQFVPRRVNLHAIAVDGSGAAYVGGDARGATVPATPGAYRTTPGQGLCTSVPSRTPPMWPCLDGVIAKLSSTGSLMYATYLHGDEPNAYAIAADSVTGLTVDAQGNAFVVGTTTSDWFPTTPGAFRSACGPDCNMRRVFVSELNAAGSGLVFSALLGGASVSNSGTGAAVSSAVFEGDPTLNGSAAGIALDALGQVLVTGWTAANDFPVVNAQQSMSGSTGMFHLTHSGTPVGAIQQPARPRHAVRPDCGRRVVRTGWRLEIVSTEAFPQ